MTTAQGAGIRPYGPGKFDTILDSHVAALTLDGPDNECGDVGENGTWYGLLAGPIFDAGTAEELPEGLTAEELVFLHQHRAGAVVVETFDGFTHVEYFATESELRMFWLECQRDAEGS